MMKQLPKTLGPQQLVLANILPASFDDAGLEHLDYFDGSYLEGFEHAVGKMSREDYTAKGIAAIQTAARKGKIIAFTIGMDKYADTDMDAEKGKDSTKDFATVHDRFTYSRAVPYLRREVQPPYASATRRNPKHRAAELVAFRFANASCFVSKGVL